MVADALTKPLARDRHAAIIKEMGISPTTIPPTQPVSGSVGIGTGRSWASVAGGVASDVAGLGNGRNGGLGSDGAKVGKRATSNSCRAPL
jgi:hypothetical protein